MALAHILTAITLDVGNGMTGEVVYKFSFERFQIWHAETHWRCQLGFNSVSAWAEIVLPTVGNVLTWAEIVLPSRGKCVDVGGDCIAKPWEMCLRERRLCCQAMGNMLTWAEIVVPSLGKCVDVSGDFTAKPWEVC